MDVRKISTVGHSIGLSLPKALLKALKVARGDLVSLELDRGCLVIAPLNRQTTRPYAKGRLRAKSR